MKYEVCNQTSAHSFGVIEADSAAAAIEAVCVNAGYKSAADAAAQTGAPCGLIATEVEAWEAWEDGKRESAVTFHAPTGGAFDIAQAGADALGVDLSEAVNVQRA